MQCRNFYFDLGTNVGIQIDKLYNQSCQSPLQKIFAKVYSKRSEVCTFGFEPNPNHVTVLQSLSQKYLDFGYYIYIYHAFAGIENTVSHLYLNPDFAYGKSNHLWTAGHKKQHNNNNTPIHIPTINILPILQSISSNSNVVVKMDIEHDEKVILPALNRSHLLCKIKYLVVEWHGSRTILNNVKHTMSCNNTQIIEIDDNVKCL
tara:strand:- start:619 stop:1230 length:612 start_codon:yes stop_codon:yes gene_type:complete